MTNAFSTAELVELVNLLSDTEATVEARAAAIDGARSRVREIYRQAWGLEPFKSLLGYCSNVMLLSEQQDMYFSADRLRCLLDGAIGRNSLTADDTAVKQAAELLRALAFEAWQLYQNQLWFDVNESDLDNSRKNSSKFGAYATFGLFRVVLLNISDTLRDGAQGDRTELFSNTTWSKLHQALGREDSSSKKPARIKTKHTADENHSDVKQLLVVIPVDLISVLSRHPSIRDEIVRLIEDLFAWKVEDRATRSFGVVCSSEHDTSESLTLFDDKLNERCTIARIGSISEPQARAFEAKKGKKKAAIVGHISKRFRYHGEVPSADPVKVSTLNQETATFRSYTSYQFISDYRQGHLIETHLHFPPRALPRIVVGPVVGRMVVTATPEEQAESAEETDVEVSVPVLIETSLRGRVTCVAIDSLSNQERRLTAEVQGGQPYVFWIQGLRPQSRYIYRFDVSIEAELMIDGEMS
ncbi:hypothetical protein PINS_up013761 [Pythium insidiosum]|nr:hypothetical protein PINS_up013761 [Pythium insidiosum]